MLVQLTVARKSMTVRNSERAWRNHGGMDRATQRRFSNREVGIDLPCGAAPFFFATRLTRLNVWGDRGAGPLLPYDDRCTDIFRARGQLAVSRRARNCRTSADSLAQGLCRPTISCTGPTYPYNIDHAAERAMIAMPLKAAKWQGSDTPVTVAVVSKPT